MAQSFYLCEQAERCRRLDRDSTDRTSRESLLLLAEEYAAGANTEEDDGVPVWQARPQATN
jgi:hypothetical protein